VYEVLLVPGSNNDVTRYIYIYTGITRKEGLYILM
jgi:hypothetical protein